MTKAPLPEKCKYSDFCNNGLFIQGIQCDSINFLISVDKKECALYPHFNELEKNKEGLKMAIMFNMGSIKEDKLIVAFITWLEKEKVNG